MVREYFSFVVRDKVREGKIGTDPVFLSVKVVFLRIWRRIPHYRPSDPCPCPPGSGWRRECSSVPSSPPLTRASPPPALSDTTSPAVRPK